MHGTTKQQGLNLTRVNPDPTWHYQNLQCDTYVTDKGSSFSYISSASSLSLKVNLIISVHIILSTSIRSSNQIQHNWFYHLHHHGFRNVSRSDIGNYPTTCWGLPPLWLWGKFFYPNAQMPFYFCSFLSFEFDLIVKSYCGKCRWSSGFVCC